jgi:hypothetical protein
MGNLSQALFWHGDTTVFAIDASLVRARRSLEIAQERNVSTEDLMLLQTAIRHLNVAASDQLWRAMVSRLDVVYRTYDLPCAIQASWVPLTHRAPPNSTPATPCFIHPDQILAIRHAAAKYPRVIYTEERLALDGITFQEESKELEMKWDAYLAGKKRGKKDDDREECVRMLAMKAQTYTKKSTKSSDGGVHGEKTARERRSGGLQRSSPAVRLSRDVPLLKARIRSTVSTKVNFIISEVCLPLSTLRRVLVRLIVLLTTFARRY